MWAAFFMPSPGCRADVSPTNGRERPAMSDLTLDDIFTDEAPEKPVEATVEAEKPVETKGEEQAEPEGAPPAPEKSVEQPRGIDAALIAERRRRQAAEAEREELRNRIAEMQQKPAPDVLDDGFADHLKEQVMREVTARMEAERGKTAFEATIAVSEKLARRQYSDFDDKLEVFASLVEQNPALALKLRESDDPAEYAYRTAKNYAEMENVGTFDMDALRDKIREEERARLLEEAQSKAPAVLPPSLTNERNVGSRRGPAWSGPTSLDDIFT